MGTNITAAKQRQLIKQADRLCKALGRAQMKAKREGWRADYERLVLVANRATWRLWRREDALKGGK